MSKEAPIKCPICKGAGTVKQPNRVANEQKKKKNIARILEKEGYSRREIASFMNFKSPTSVQRLLAD